MELFYLLKREIDQPLKPLLLFLLISGMVNGLLIAVINNAAEHVSNSEISGKSFMLFVIGVFIFLTAKKYVLDQSTNLVENTVCQLRNRIADKIRHTELSTLEAVGTSPLYARLTRDASYVSELSSHFIGSIQSAIMIFFTILYIGTVSSSSFVLIVLTISCGLIYYYIKASSFILLWQEVSRKETAFFETLGHILNGFKEIKINRSKNEAVLNNYRIVNESLNKHKTAVGKEYNGLLIFSQAFFYLLLGSTLFIIPHYHTEHSADVIKVTAAILSIMGPFEAVMVSLRLFDNAGVAAQNIISLEEQLEAELSKNTLSIEAQNHPSSYQLLSYEKNIQLQNLIYSYPSSKEQDYIFTVGPINLTFGKGELIFITGGNGSGKSTFLKLLTGLYPPQSGNIVLDVGGEEDSEVLVTAANYQQYRNLYTTIFTDFHLFDKIYGVSKINPKMVKRLLANMDLSEQKTTYKNGGFTNVNLSSGQKKRLALTTSLVEDKPIYILDEVASDLDPEFRDTYYYDLLGELRDRNKTVIVVSHDRHYWEVADRLLIMTNGTIQELSKKEIKSLLAKEKA